MDTSLSKERNAIALTTKLFSLHRHPVPYNAYFVAGSDVEFSASPQTGELLPAGSNGTLIKINFKPTKYGKIYQGKLVVQVRRSILKCMQRQSSLQ